MKPRGVMLPEKPTDPNNYLDFEVEWDENVRQLILCIGKRYTIWLLEQTIKEENDHDHDERLHGTDQLQDH